MRSVVDRFDTITSNQGFSKTSWLEQNQPYIQVAFNIAMIFAVNDLMITIWRSMTGH
jgi:maltodextrin utilization protein YvdJ